MDGRRRGLSALTCKRAREVLQESGYAAAISSRSEDVAYLIQAAAFLYRVVTEGRQAEVVLLTQADEVPLLLCMDAYVGYYGSIGVRAEPISTLDQALKDLASETAGKLAIPGAAPYSLFEGARVALGAERVEVADPIARARLCKSPAEIEVMREAAAIAEAGMAAALQACGDGVRECDAASSAEAAMRALGADAFCFSTMVITGQDLGLMREVTGERVMRNGDWVLIDLGCTKGGYNVEFARSRMVGPVTDEYRRAYQAVLTAQTAALATIRGGSAIAAADTAAKQTLAAAGYEAYSYQHVIGHGIGTGVWEDPTVEGKSSGSFHEGMVVAIEPGVFIPEVGGIRLEDVVLVTATGCERLTRFPVLAECAWQAWDPLRN
jgi:Xaa-Pro aminopeptidase